MSNVTRINPTYNPHRERCDECGVDLAAVFHPFDFRSQPSADRPIDERALASRSEVFKEIPAGDSSVFYAATPVQYASVRGSAYGWAKMNDRKLRAKRLCSKHVEVIHVSRSRRAERA
jgi:hypothetical protein